MSQKTNLAEINSKNKVVYEEDQHTKSVALNALWLDPFAPQALFIKSSARSLYRAPFSIDLDELKKVLNETNLVVIRIKEDASLYDEVFELVNSVNYDFQLSAELIGVTLNLVYK